MPYSEMGGFPTTVIDYASPDMAGLPLGALTRFAANSGPDMAGLTAPTDGWSPGAHRQVPNIDGPAWSSKTLPGTTAAGTPVYGNGVVCMTIGAASINQLYRSADLGQTWQTITLPTSQDWKTMATDGKGTWIILAGNNAPNANYVISRDNGLNWTAKTMPIALQWYALGWGNGCYIAIAFNTSNSYYSPDGLTWTLGGTGVLGTAGYRAVVSNGLGLTIAVSNSTSVYRTTDNATTWQAPTNLVAANSLFGVWMPQPGLFIIPGNGTANIYTSPDGANWTAVPAPSFISAWGQPAVHNGLFVMPASASTNVCISSDGINFVLARNVMPSAAFWNLTGGGGVFMANKSLNTAAAVGLF